MGSALEPGDMQKPTSPPGGKPLDFQSSMAEAIENALHALLGEEGMKQFDVNVDTQAARDRRRIMIAIAQGVIAHLFNNAAAFTVTGTDSVGGNINASITINKGCTLLGGL